MQVKFACPAVKGESYKNFFALVFCFEFFRHFLQLRICSSCLPKFVQPFLLYCPSNVLRTQLPAFLDCPAPSEEFACCFPARRGPYRTPSEGNLPAFGFKNPPF